MLGGLETSRRPAMDSALCGAGDVGPVRKTHGTASDATQFRLQAFAQEKSGVAHGQTFPDWAFCGLPVI